MARGQVGLDGLAGRQQEVSLRGARFSASVQVAARARQSKVGDALFTVGWAVWASSVRGWARKIGGKGAGPATEVDPGRLNSNNSFDYLFPLKLIQP